MIIALGIYQTTARSCCGECNYMKREYSYDELFDKFKLIYQYNLQHANITMTIEPETINTTGVVMSFRGNKKTPEQIREASRLRKQKQRADLQAKYGDEEYKKNHVKANRRGQIETQATNQLIKNIILYFLLKQY